MSLDEFSMSLGFNFEAERRSVQTQPLSLRSGRFGQTNRRFRLEEFVGFEGRGWIYDERVLQYDAMLRVGLSQERFEESRPGRNQSTGPDGSLLEYDIRLNLFPAGRISATAYASQLDDRVQRPFLPSLDRRRERYGANVVYNDPVLPMQLSYEHLFDDLTSGSPNLFDDEQRGEDTLRYELTWQPSDRHRLNLQYEYERRDEQFSGTQTQFNTTRSFLSIDHGISFGEDDRNRLDTLLRWEEESGDLARDAFEFAPTLRLQHTDDWFSTYRFQYLDQSFIDIETETYRGDASLTYQYEDVFIGSASIYGLRENAEQNPDTTEWGGQIDLAFNKKNNLGHFSSNFTYLHANTRTDNGTRRAAVVDEAVTFRDPLPVFLAQRNIDPISIAVRDATRAIIYLPGIDYIVIPTGDTVALQRVFTGRIPNGQTVLVTYSYRSFDDLQISRDRIDFRMQQAFEGGVDVYYALSLQNEDISRKRFISFTDRDIQRHRVGATLRKTKWSAGLELEYNDDAVDPYAAAHVNGDVILYEDDKQQLSGRGNYSYFRFEGEGFLEQRYTNLVDLGMTYRYALGSDLEANAQALYRFQDDSLFGKTNGFDLNASLAYRIGLFSVLVEAEYDLLDLPTSTDDSVGIWLKLRRDIPLIGARAQR